MGVLYFLAGSLVGFVLALGLVFLMTLNIGKDSQDNLIEKKEADRDRIVKENEPTAEEVNLLTEAVRVLSNDDSNNSQSNEHPTEEQAPVDLKEMEAEFLKRSDLARERQKHLKLICSFLQELSRVHDQMGKELKKLSATSEQHVEDENGFILHKWWNAIAIALDHISKSQLSLGNSITDAVYSPMSRVELEHSHLERQLNVEATKLISKMKECQTHFDLKTREHDKIKEKIVAPPSDAGVSTPKPVSSKFQASELALTEACAKLAASQQEYNEKMPRLLADFKLMASNCMASTMENLLHLSTILGSPHQESAVAVRRLKMDLATTTAESPDKHSYGPIVLKLLNEIQREEDKPHLDMSLEATARLAACSLSRLPPLPSQFDDCIGKETCVWFNALSGRMYRDAARSLGFHDWFCAKVAHLLNKGKKSPLFDKYTVTSPSFGSTPPLMMNIQWAPSTPKAPTPHHTSAPRDLEHDVECTADISFRSSISFAVHTKFWINWPREKCAHIPMSIVLEMTELSGRIRFGVKKHSSFLSFVHEPYTRFHVSSELGDQYKLKNLPKVSSVIINKLKKHIRTKLIYPNCFKLRLIWPRKWWPAGGEHLFKSETEAAAATDPAPAPAPTVNAAPLLPAPTTPTRTTSESQIGGADVEERDMVEEKLSEEMTQSTVDMAASLTGINPSILGSIGTQTFSPHSGALTEEDRIGAPTECSENILLSPEGDSQSIFRRFLRPLATPKASAYADVPSENNQDDHDPGFCSIGQCTELARSPTLQSGCIGEVDDKDYVAPLWKDTVSVNETVSTSRLKIHVPNMNSSHRSATEKLKVTRIKMDLDKYNQINVSRPDHVRMYVSDLLMQASLPNHNLLRRRAADDILVRDKHFASESIAIVRSRAHSISDFRHSTLDAMWSEFLGSIGHDFGELSAQIRLKSTAKVHAKGSMPSIFSFLRGSHKIRDKKRSSTLTSSDDEACASKQKGAASSRFKLNFPSSQFGKGGKSRQSLNTGENSPSQRSLLSDFDTEDSPEDRSNQGYRRNLGRVVDVLKSGRNSKTQSPGPNGHHPSEAKQNSIEIDNEVMNLTWRAQAEAITQAAARGEHFQMQNFMRTPKSTSPKSWIVMRDGVLTIYPSADGISAMERNTPAALYRLCGCACRPLDQPLSFEAGFVSDKQGRASQVEWVQFWVETEIQCRAWVMALQHAAILPSAPKSSSGGYNKGR